MASPSPISSHYDERYFAWQASLGEFGGWANKPFFQKFVAKDARVLDFGCGGGELLKNLDCREKVGIEVNAAAANAARKVGLIVYERATDVPNDSVDIIISTNVLEHTLRPLDELCELRRKLTSEGRIVFVVPCEHISYRYERDDVNHHLYSWSPMCLGNLFTEAGFTVIECSPLIHKWPPFFRWIARLGGRKVFNLACAVYGRLERSWFQVMIVADNPGECSSENDDLDCDN